MLDSAPQVRKHLAGNPLAPHLGAFATSLSESGYTNGTVQVKVIFLTGFGRWLRKTGRTVARLDEQCANAFVRQKRRVHRGEPKTLRQFINHLRQRGLVPDRKLLCDRSPLADVLNRYETHLRSEHGLVTSTIDNYQSFVRKL